MNGVLLLDNLRGTEQTSIKCPGIPLLLRAQNLIAQIKFPQPIFTLQYNDGSQARISDTTTVCFPDPQEGA